MYANIIAKRIFNLYNRSIQALFMMLIYNMYVVHALCIHYMNEPVTLRKYIPFDFFIYLLYSNKLVTVMWKNHVIK